MLDLRHTGLGLRVPSPAAITETAVVNLLEEDLPCPWCHSQTAEADPRCPSCGRRFG